MLMVGTLTATYASFPVQRTTTNNTNTTVVVENQEDELSSPAIVGEGKSQIIGTHTSKCINSETKLKFLNEETKRKAHKRLGNFMARFYSNTTLKCFSIWKRIN